MLGLPQTTDWTSNILPPGHMPNPGNQACAVCHTAIGSTLASYATLASIAVLHTGISGNCGQCHGATTQLTFYNNNDNPKSGVLTPAHIPYLSGTDCSSCHAANYVAGGFGPTNMSAAKHAFVPTACDTCHEAGLSFYLGASTPALQGRPTDHMSPTGTPQQQTGDCSGCHNTTDWTTNVMPAGHMPNPGNQTCAVCHTAISGSAASYATLASIAVLHTGISGNCGQCHGSPSGALSFYNNNDNPKAAVLSPAHIPYLNGADCSSCHAANYVAGGFGPTNMSAAKHAFVPTTCDTCHEAGLTFYLGASTPALQGRPPGHVSAPNPPSQATGDCSLCHNTTVWTTPTTLPNGHMPIPGTQTCSVCHVGNLSTPAGYATMASIPILHTGITTGCAQCHGGATALTFYNNNDNPKAAAGLSPAHIPAFTGEDCSACHAPNYVAGGFGPMNMTQATHAGVGTTCINCHEAGLSFYMGAASPGLQGRPADHTAGQQVAPNDCSLCHSTANWNTTALPAGHMPNPANQACNVCHTAAPANYTTLAANSVLHTGISSGCGQCHGGTSALTWYNNFTPKDAVLAPSHIPYLAGTDCGSCHKSSTYAVGSFGPMNMTQATHAFVQCHDLQHLPRGGRELLHGRGESRAAGPAGRSHVGSNGGAERLQPLPHDGQLEQHGDACGPYAESGQSGVQHLPHRSAGQLHDARRECGPAYRHHEQPMCSVPWRYDAAHLVQQLHAEGCGAHALAHSVPRRHELRLLPLLEHLCGRRLRTDEHDAGDSCVRGDHLRHVPREGPELLHGCGESRAAGPAGRSHLRSDGGAQRLQHLPHDGELEQHDIARRAHAEPRQSDLHRLPHRRAVQLRDARGQRRSSHRHHLGLHYLPRCAERGCAGVLSQLHAEGRDSLARAHPDQHHAVRELPRGQFHLIQRHDDECVQAHHDARR